MRHILTYCFLEIKRTFKLLPKLIIGAIVLSLVIGSIAFCAEKLIYNNDFSESKATITYSVNDTHSMTNLIVSVLTNSKSAKNFCKFIKTEDNEVKELVNDNNVLAGVIVPAGFMKSLLNGSNYSIEVVLPQTLSLYSLIIIELTRAFEKTLSAAQAGVYALYDFYKNESLLEYEDNANTDINGIYLSHAFSREKIFNTKLVSATGSLSTTEYYISSAVILLLLLLGFSFIDYIKENSKIFIQLLRHSNIPLFVIVLIRIIAIFLVYLFFISLPIITIYLLNIFQIISININIVSALYNSIIITLTISAIIVFISTLTSGKNSCILLLFFYNIISCFISGYFIPLAFLPESIQALSKYFPSTYLLKSFGNIIKSNMDFQNSIALIITIVICFLFAYLAEIHSYSNVYKKMGGRHESSSM